MNYDIQGFLTEIIKTLDNVYIIFDNIKERNILDKIQTIIENLQIINTKNTFTILKFIAINSSTLFSTYNLRYFSTIFPDKNSYKQNLPVNEYAKSLFSNNEENKNKFIVRYKNNAKDNINTFNDDSIDYLIFLIKLLHNSSFKESNNFLDYNYKYYLI